MVLKLLLIASLVLMAQPLAAQTADDHFHRGAQFYVFGEKTNAVVEVVTGLQRFPNDEKLRALAEILAREEEQQQQQQQAQQQNQDQQEQERKEQQPNQPQSGQDQKEEQEKSDPGQKDESQAQSAEEQEEKDGKEGEPAQSMQVRAMTPDEAQRLLDAQKGEERFLQLKPAEKPESRRRPLKAWSLPPASNFVQR